MENFKFSEFKNKLEAKKIILFGAGDIGELVKYSLNQISVNVDYYCDNDFRKHNTDYLGTKVLSPKDLDSLDKEKTIVFISNNYISVIRGQLKKLGFKQIFDCVEILKNTDFFKAKQSFALQPYKIDRRIDYYISMCMKEKYISSGTLNIKSIDIQITERCSMKCKNCSNLMQYYNKPVNSDMDELFLSIDRFMSCVDNIYEFRVLGGDPFMNKDLYKVVDQLKKYEKVKKIIVYTNARIIPKGANLDCLKHKKVVVDITNYGEGLSTKHDEIIKILKENEILYSTTLTTVWTDSGRVLPYQEETLDEKKSKFINCCNSDILSILHGKLYRCPFSANATNLKAVPFEKKDIVDLCDKDISIPELKVRIKDLAYNKDFLIACSYCNGRDYTVQNIKAAEQTSKPLPYKVF